MNKHSAGVLPFRFHDGNLEVFLVHMGGPYWQKKDEGAWSITKGLHEEGEDPLETAKREFKEETGIEVDGDFVDLGQIKQPSKKIIQVWALEKNIVEINITSNTFSLEWPPHSGKLQEFPEIDRAAWFHLAEARKKILKGQAGFLDRLAKLVDYIPSKEESELIAVPKQGLLF